MTCPFLMGDRQPSQMTCPYGRSPQVARLALTGFFREQPVLLYRKGVVKNSWYGDTSRGAGRSIREGHLSCDVLICRPNASPLQLSAANGYQLLVTTPVSERRSGCGNSELVLLAAHDRASQLAGVSAGKEVKAIS